MVENEQMDHEIDIYRQITELWSQVMANKVPTMYFNREEIARTIYGS